MRIWFDADNAPHVLIMRRLTRELEEKGHDVRFTARDRASICELLTLSGIRYSKVGREYGKGKLGKVLGTLGRALSLVRTMRSWKPDVSFGHGSRSLPIASRILGVPTVTMFDYEWVDTTLFNLLCKTILIPSYIDEQRCREARIKLGKVKHYTGLKEEIYIGDLCGDPGELSPLGLREDKVHLLLRPPATQAHYHDSRSLALLSDLMELLGKRPDLQVVFLPRYEDQKEYINPDSKAEFIVPDRAYDGPMLVSAMDLVISGGGTMSREAAALGIPSYSLFTGRLVMLRSTGDVRAKVRISKRVEALESSVNKELIELIVRQIIEAA